MADSGSTSFAESTVGASDGASTHASGHKSASFSATDSHDHGGNGPPLSQQVAKVNAVDKYFEEIFPVPDLGIGFDQILSKTLANDRQNGLPGIAVLPSVAKFMVMQCQLIRAQHVLEVGTLSGYSAMWFAIAAKCHVTTLEVNSEYAKLARQNFIEASCAEQVEIMVGDAVETMGQIVADIAKGRRPRPKLVFIDANKDASLVYYKLAVQAVGSGGIVVVDNLVRWGEVVNEDKVRAGDPVVCGIRALADYAGRDERVDATVIRMLSEGVYDGFLYAVVK